MKRKMTGLILGILWLLSGGSAQAEPRRGAEPPPAAAAAPGHVVNVNDASPEQLTLLPGIGPSKAKAIVDHRKAHPFKRAEELTRIKGIGKKTFARLKPLIALSGPTTLTERPARQQRRQ